MSFYAGNRKKTLAVGKLLRIGLIAKAIESKNEYIKVSAGLGTERSLERARTGVPMGSGEFLENGCLFVIFSRVIGKKFFLLNVTVVGMFRGICFIFGVANVVDFLDESLLFSSFVTVCF